MWNESLSQPLPWVLHSNKINLQYIQGLFDAEGCIFMKNEKKQDVRISISQKSHIDLLFAIRDFLGMGSVDEKEGKFSVFSFSKCLHLHP